MDASDIVQYQDRLYQTPLLFNDKFVSFKEVSEFVRVRLDGSTGDLFDEGEAPASLKKEIATIISAAKPVCFFYIAGNHDDEFSFADRPDNLYLFSENHSWKSYDLQDNITLTGIDERNMREEAYQTFSLPSERYNIVMMHGPVANGEISLSQLRDKNIDYLALGHIHLPSLNAERLDSRGHYRYCGC